MNDDIMSEGNDANDETATTTTEINLLLDGDGRTTYDPALFPPHRGRTEAATTTTANDDDGNPNKRARGADDPPGDRPAPSSSSSSTSTSTSSSSSPLDYSSKTALTNLASMAIPSSQQRDPYDELLFDCEIADCGMMPRTYWVSPDDDDDDHPPRCFLEKMALDVFHRHVPPPTSSDGGGCCCYDPRSSGAEWWVQIRPSPPGTGRYSMLSTPGGEGNGMVDSGGIDFHWDKDEELWKMCGGSVFVHPHVSTVTYLTDLGAPTVVLSRRVDAATGRYLDDGDGPSPTRTSSARTEGFVSWPRRGKHLSFDGRMLHAAPSDLMGEGLFERQCADPRGDDDDDAAAAVATGDDEDDGDRTRKTLARRKRRVTFLVNVWLNHRPIGVMPFPDGMVGRLRGSDLFGDDFEMFDEDDGGGDDRNAGVVAPRDGHPATTTTTKVIVRGGVASLVEGRTPSTADDDDGRCRKVDQTRNGGIELTKMVWPMGGGEEDGSIEALVPLDLIRAKGETGSDVAITWMDGFVLGGVGA